MKKVEVSAKSFDNTFRSAEKQLNQMIFEEAQNPVANLPRLKEEMKKLLFFVKNELEQAE